MRTKLDEIVEEEFEEVPASRADFLARGNRIAERAFRHGVERTIAMTDVISGHTFDFNGKGWMNAIEMGVEAARMQMANAQPAPAEEKVVAAHPWPCKHNDRRRHEEIVYGGRFHLPGWTTSAPDRRAPASRPEASVKIHPLFSAVLDSMIGIGSIPPSVTEWTKAGRPILEEPRP